MYVLPDTPTGYMSEDGGSPRPVDPNAMDVDTVNSPPAVSPQTGKSKLMNIKNTEHVTFVSYSLLLIDLGLGPSLSSLLVSTDHFYTRRIIHLRRTFQTFVVRLLTLSGVNTLRRAQDRLYVLSFPLECVLEGELAWIVRQEA